MTAWVDRVARLGALLVLSVGVLGFGAISLCGGFFTAGMLPTLWTADAPAALPMMVISVPSLLGGGLVAWRLVKHIAKLMKSRSMERRHE